MNTELELDCPWCDGHMVAAEVAGGNVVDALACATCSIVVDLAPDPVATPVALAA